MSAPIRMTKAQAARFVEVVAQGCPAKLPVPRAMVAGQIGLWQVWRGDYWLAMEAADLVVTAPTAAVGCRRICDEEVLSFVMVARGGDSPYALRWTSA
jgi:hypothetical protein